MERPKTQNESTYQNKTHSLLFNELPKKHQHTETQLL